MAHYRDRDGNYIGQFSDGARPPEGAIETTAPPRGDATYRDGVWVVPPPPKSKVKEEALRRIDAIADPRTRDQLFQRALRLIMKVAIEGGTLTVEEQAEIAAGKQQAEQIEDIQAAERALLAMDPIPSDYNDDRYWQ